MASPAEVVRVCLLAQELVTPPGGSGLLPFQQLPGDGSAVCFVSSMPDEVDQGVCIYDTGGVLWGRRQPDGRTLTHPAIQIIIRALDYKGYSLANSLAQGLDKIKVGVVIVNGEEIFVSSVYRTSGVISLGEEVGKRRQLWSLNARVAFQDRQNPLG